MKQAYCIFENVKINEQKKLDEYREKVPPIVEQFGGSYLTASDQIRSTEGGWKPDFLVIIKFPSLEQANKWYDSKEYREIRELRKSSGEFKAVIVEGL